MDGGSLSLKWYAVYTKPRQEDIVINALERAGIKAFCPKLKGMRYIRQRYREVVLPLFPCYIFARFDFGKSCRLVKYTRGVKAIVAGNNAPWPVAEEIIKAIESNMDEDDTVTIRPEVKPGQRLEIKDGPFRGLAGIFERQMTSTERVIVLLNTIEYQARIEIETRYLAEGTFIA